MKICNRIAMLLVVAAMASATLSGCGTAVRTVVAAIRAANTTAQTQIPGSDSTGYTDAAALVDGVPDPSIAELNARIKNDTPINKLTPYASGPGVVVFDPVSPSALTDLGNGIGGWLSLYVAGQPQFGKSPIRGSARRAAYEIGKPNLELTAADAIHVGNLVGATHVAVATLTGNPAHCTLTYQLLDIRTKQRVGPPYVVSGTEDQIAAKLPAIARGMVGSLNATAADLPTAIGMNASDLAFVGHMTMSENTMTATQSDIKRLRGLENSSPFAAFTYIEYAGVFSATDSRNAASVLFTQIPTNSIATSGVAWSASDVLPVFSEQIEKDRVQYPHNYLIALTSAYLHREDDNPQLERKAVEDCVRASPRNPDAWLTIARTICDEADDVRHARFSSDMSATEEQFVNSLYPDWEYCAKQSTDLDPLFGKGWGRLAQAATFNGDTSVATIAFWNAVKLDPEKGEVYDWGLQMFQSKWGGDPSTLAKVATMAASARYDSANDATWVAADLDGAGLIPQERTLLSNQRDLLQSDIAQAPNNGFLHWGLATVLSNGGQTGRALGEYRLAEKLLPYRADLHYSIGGYFDKIDQAPIAVAEYRQAIALDPDTEAHYDLGYDLKHLGQFPAAQQELGTAARLYPYLGTAYFGLAELDLMQNRFSQSLPEYRKALALEPYLLTGYEHFVNTLDRTGGYDEALKYGKLALGMSPKDTVIVNALADVYLNKHLPNSSIRLSRYAISINAGDSWAHENMAEAYQQLGEKNQAHAEWNTVISLGKPYYVAAAKQRMAQY